MWRCQIRRMQDTEGLYIISVAALLLEMHPQTLRKYERVGFVTPSRTIGMLRLYSAEDIERLRIVKHLVEDRGLNLAGVELVLEIMPELKKLAKVAESKDDFEDMQNQVNASVEKIFNTLKLGSEEKSRSATYLIIS